MRRLLCIVNGSAGSSDGDNLDAALAVLRAEADVEVISTETIDELTEAIRGRDGREIVIVGGDGSLNAFATALCRAGSLGEDPPTVGLVPLGTGNDFARGLDIPRESIPAARAVLDAPTRPIDVLIDGDDRLVANAVHIGVGEEAGRIAGPWKERLAKVRLGVLGYLVGGVAAGFGRPGRHLRVVADGEVISDGSRRVLQVAVTIGTSVGGGARIAPDADPGDGRAEVVVSFAISLARRLRYALHVALRRHPELDDVVTVRARTVTVTGVNRGAAANADGELLEPALERTWRVVPGAYRLHAPQESA